MGLLPLLVLVLLLLLLLLPAVTARPAAKLEEQGFSDVLYLSLKGAGLSLCLRPPPPGAAPPDDDDAEGVGPAAQATAYAGWVVTEVHLYTDGVNGFCQYTASPLPAGAATPILLHYSLFSPV